MHFIDSDKDDENLIVELNSVPGKVMVSEILLDPLVFLHVILFTDRN